MKIGIISEHKFRLTPPLSSDWVIYNFSISKTSISPTDILDSAFSTPSRYIQEVFNRLENTAGCKKPSTKFIFNPLFETNRPSLIISINTLSKLSPFDGITVLTDINNLPIGYLFPSFIPSIDSKYLTLLSATSGSLDAELLQSLFHTKTRCLSAPRIKLKNFDNGGFSFRELADTYTWAAKKAHEAILKAYSENNSEEKSTISLEKCRDNIPFTAIMPFHAGDVLFFTIAFNYTNTHISRLAVNSVYKNIVSEICPELNCLTLKTPPPNREPKGNTSRPTPDHVFLNQVKEQLPLDSFYYFCRQSRNYNLPDFHLIDQFAFALGSSFNSIEDLLFNRNTPPSPFHPQTQTKEKRILLHFDGGWPLKVYPSEPQEILTRLLISKGYQVTVLSDTPLPNLKCDVVPFSNLDSFEDLLRSHHLLVGMDSFPCHYAAHILGLPTICLFASTKPSNSNAPPTSIYSHLEQGLKCRPCYATNTCPIYGDNFCRNFVPPEVVVEKVDEILGVSQDIPTAPYLSKTRSIDTHSELINSTTSEKRLIRIKTSNLELRAYIAELIIPFYCYSSTLLREFSASVHREGMLGALRRTARYLKRLIK